MKQYSDVDYRQASKIKGALYDPRTSDYGSHVASQLWFNSVLGLFRGSDGVDVFSLLRNDKAITISGLFTYNPSSGNVPFAVHSSKTDVVANLNSDRVDGYHAAEAATVSTLAARDANGNINVATPTSAAHAATKAYVDSIAAGQDWKDSCRAATTAALPSYNHSSGVLTATANGALSAQDGVTLLAGESLLVKDETGLNAKYNGLYQVTQVGDGSNPFILTRRADADENAEVTSGLTTYIEEGTANAGAGFTLTTSGTITVGTTDLEFTRTSGGSVYAAGNGIVKSGTTFHFGKTAAYSVGDLPFCSGSTTIGFVSAGAAGTVLKGQGAGAPIFAAVDLTADVTGTLPIGKGGTGTATQFTQGSVIFAGGSGVYTQDNAGLFFDAANNRLGVNSPSPTTTLSVNGTSYIATSLGIGTDVPNEQLEITGNFRMPATTATAGIIYRDGERFIHNFQHPTGSTAVPTGRNVFVGQSSGNFTLGSTATLTAHGSFNNGFGWATLDALTTGYSNNGFGYAVLTNVTTGIDNSAFGHLVLTSVTTGLRNSGFGAYALQDVTEGNYNIGFGYSAAPNITTASFTVAIGLSSVESNLTQDGLVGVGRATLRYITTGTYDIALGYQAGMSKVGGGNLTSSSSSIFIGDNTKGTEGATNEIVLGASAEGNGSNTATLGGSSITKTFLRGNIGAGTTDLEAWNASYSAIEFGRSAVMAAKSGSDLYLLSNAYYDGAWKYKTASAAGRAYWSSGQFFIAVAASGTIDTAITWTSALTVGNNGAVSLGVLADSSSNSVITQNGGLLEKRTPNAGIWTANHGSNRFMLTDGSGVMTSSSAFTYTGNRIGLGGAVSSIAGLRVFTVDDAVDANSTTYEIAITADSTTCYDIATGITDSGFRAGFLADGYANDADFQGILAAQYGALIRHGHGASSAGGTITNSYGIYIDTYEAGSTTLTNIWGLYQASANAKNYLGGSLTLNTLATSASSVAVLVHESGLVKQRNLPSAAFSGDADTVDTYHAADLLDLANSTGDTDDISEGLTNLFYTDARARAALSSEASAEIAYNSSTGAIGLGTEAGRVKSGLIGDGSNTSLTFTHNLNTRDVLVQVFRTGTPYDEILVDKARNTVNQVTISGFDTPPSAGEYTVVVSAANG